VIDPNSANMLPLHDSVANLVSAMQAQRRQRDGRWTVADARRRGSDGQRGGIFAEAKRRAAAIATRRDRAATALQRAVGWQR